MDFLISGLDEIDKSGTLCLGRFWMRRGFKIWPSYFALLIVLALSGATVAAGSATGPAVPESWPAHVFFFQNYLPDNPYGPTWSVAVEGHFYLFLVSLAFPVIAPVMGVIAALEIDIALRFGVQPAFFGTCSVLVGWLMTRLVEDPALRLRRLLFDAPKGPRPAPAAAQGDRRERRPSPVLQPVR